MVQAKCNDSDLLLTIPGELISLSALLKNLLDDENQHTESEVVEFDVPYQAVKDILEYCHTIEYQPPQISYKEQMQRNL